LFRGHSKGDFKRKLISTETDLAVIPGGMTSILQVLHVVVKKPFKDYLKEQYNTWLLENDLQYTRTCKLKKPSLNSLSLDTTRLAKNNSEFYNTGVSVHGDVKNVTRKLSNFIKPKR
jgi:hypothetical protein